MAQSKRSLSVIMGGAAIALSAVTFIKTQESGKTEHLAPYRDPAGIWTVCDGLTGVPMQRYSSAECKALFETTVAPLAGQVADATPGFSALPPGVKIATLSLAYNTGIGAYRSSTYRLGLIADALPNACADIKRFHYINHGKTDCKIRSNNCWGVWQRRLSEYDLCVSGSIHDRPV